MVAAPVGFGAADGAGRVPDGAQSRKGECLRRATYRDRRGYPGLARTRTVNVAHFVCVCVCA